LIEDLEIDLSVSFGGHGMLILLVAYRAHDQTAWVEKAVQADLGVIASFIFASLVAHLIS
jgi:hypothetical protein